MARPLSSSDAELRDLSTASEWTPRMLTGTVLRAQGGVYQVETGEGVVEAVLRGKLKREDRTGERVVVGDEVELQEEGERWTIEQVRERRSVLARRAPGKAPRAKVIVANVDRIVIVFSVSRPDPHLRMLDRFLVLCEATNLDPLIVANKVDLLPEAEVDALFAPYTAAGYTVLRTSTKLDGGVDTLRDALRGRISALTGPSGVGKSSLLNSVQPGLALRVASISEAVLKGRHTTVTAQLIPLEGGGYVADTPGLRELGLWEIDRTELDHYFPELVPYLGSCRYGNSCTHIHEPKCAIREAVAAGTVHTGRYESYRRMMEGEEEGWEA